MFFCELTPLGVETGLHEVLIILFRLVFFACQSHMIEDNAEEGLL